jgi:glycosyltransferase involved in cell wall biosynthesis
MKPPKISVIIPVYNGERFVRDAIDSILHQTFADFELIIINDGSSDSSANIILSYADPRIVFINNDENTGLPNVRNQGLDASRGEYIAWLDCDDISVPCRLEKQAKLLDNNSQIGVCGAWMKITSNSNDSIAQYPTDPEYIRASLLFNNCLANSTVMMRAACTREIGLRFELSHYLSQDYGLWVRIPKTWRIINLPEVLTIYRLHPNQVTKIHSQKQVDISWEIQKTQLLDLGIVAPSADEKKIHMSLGGFIQNTFQDPINLIKAKEYLIKLDEANKKFGKYDKKTFREILLEKWMSASSSSASGKLIFPSYWIRLVFGAVKFGLSGRTAKKIGQAIARDFRSLLTM